MRHIIVRNVKRTSPKCFAAIAKSTLNPATTINARLGRISNDAELEAKKIRPPSLSGGLLILGIIKQFKRIIRSQMEKFT